MNNQFTQPSGSTSVKINRQTVARLFGVKVSEVLLPTVGAPAYGSRVLYDKTLQRAFTLPYDIQPSATVTSYSNGILVMTNDYGITRDLPALAAQRGEYNFLKDGSFIDGGKILFKNDCLLNTGPAPGFYRWAGSIPSGGYVVAPGSSPATAGGISSTGWVPVDVPGMISQFAAADGLKLIGEVASVTTLRTIPGVAGQKIRLKEYATGLGVGGGELFGVSSSSRTDDGVTFFRVNSSFGWARDVSNGISFQDAGAVGDGTYTSTTSAGTDDTAAVLRGLSARVPIVERTPRNYRLASSVTLSDGFVNFKGLGKGVTTFIYDHMLSGITLGSEVLNTTKYYGNFSGCSCVRPNYLAYSGTIGPKSFAFGNFQPLWLSDIEEQHAIGYGIFAVFSNQVHARGNTARDHVGTFAATRSGTDGLHFYKCNDVWATENFVSNIGDDGISSGSYDINNPCTNINFTNNRLSSVFGTLKLYGFVEKAEIAQNTFTTGHEAGVYLTNDANAPAGSYIKNIMIHHNKFSGIIGGSTNTVAGGVLLRTWPDNGTANATAVIDSIWITDNTFENCGSGVAAVTQDTYKRYSNLYIRNNTFRGVDPSLTGSRPYIRIHQCDYEMEISNNYFSNAHSQAIAIDHIYGSFTASMTQPVWKILDNHVVGYSMGNGLSALVNGILVRYSSYDLLLHMTNNQVYGQAVSDTLASVQAILVNNINPNSFVEANQSENNIAIASGTSAYKGTAKTRTGAPNAGTHYAGSTITDYGNSIRYTVKTNGTYGSIGSVTATTTSGSKSIIVNDPTNIYAGCIISIVGVTGSKKVISRVGTTVVLDTACDATVSGATVAYVAPTLITEAMA